MVKLAWAMIVKGSESEAIALNTCLEDFTPYVDKVFITITHKPGEERNKAVEAICQKYGAEISDFEWINDFTAARNFNFSQVPKDYTHIGWCDADDGVRGALKMKPTLESHPAIDAFTMFYLYSFDEHGNATTVHQKTRIVKNDDTWHWEGRGLHESLVPNRGVTTFGLTGVEVIHLTTGERLDDSRQRNYEIAKSWATKNPEDPTVYYNVGNSAFGIGKYDESLEAFRLFLSLSRSDEEKYIARLRIADVLWAQKKIEQALDEARYAIGLKPEYPDAYHLAGKLFYQMNQFAKAKDMFLNGLGRPAPYYSIIVYNPREYDYQPLMDLAKTYYSLNLPQLALPALEAAVKIVPADAALKKLIKTLKQESKEGDEVVKLCGRLRKITDKEKLRKQLDKIPPKFKYHPAVLNIRNVNFPKLESSGKDLVIFCGFTAEEWTPESIAKKGSGGSEEAAIRMAQGLADKGWNVTVYNNCGTEESVHGKVTYKPYMAWNYRDKQDVVILWRNTKPLDWDINAPKIFVDMHDVIPKGEFTEERLQRVNGIFFKSQWHRALYPVVPDKKCIIIPNGIETSVFETEVKKDDNLIINTASPVRALSALIDIMKQVRQEIPDAKMQWAYGWITTDAGMASEPKYPEWKENILKGMAENGIEDIGRLTHKQVAELNNKASIYVYPTGFPEIDCMSITKALAAGAYPITTDFGAIKEKSGHGGKFIHYEDSYEKPGQIDYSIENEEVKKQFAQEIIDKLKNPPSSEERLQMKQYALQKYGWEGIVEEWDAVLTA